MKFEPEAMRYRILDVPARLIRTRRRRIPKIPDTWPWASVLIAPFARIAAIPQPD